MMRKAKLGLLPLYIKLYDEIDPSVRKGFASFLLSITRALEKEGVEVSRAPICSVAAEFRRAVASFEKAGVDLIATLHLAYSPSGESADVLCETAIPLLMLDTTMDFSFGDEVAPERLMYNHGIHGVQDLASVLRRRGRSFSLVAGHHQQSDVLRRAADIARAALAAREFRDARVLRIGRPFKNMSDFHVDSRTLKRLFGISVKQILPKALSASVASVTNLEIDTEVKDDRKRYRVFASPDCHRRSVRVALGVRKYLDTGAYSAWSANFLDFNSKTGPVCVVPFLEAGKAMARGMGYAGEGDVLTAALTGALIRGFVDATFAEIFCPDWKGNSLFLSHMGEVNPAVAASKPTLEEKEYAFSNALNPAYLACAPRHGPAVFVNLSGGPGDSFRLIAAPVEVLHDTRRRVYRNVIRCWMRPETSVAHFLERYSLLGGTHHSVLVLGNHLEALEAFADMSGFEFAKV